MPKRGTIPYTRDRGKKGFWFRYTIKSEYQPILGRQSVVRSLGTRDRKQAAIRVGRYIEDMSHWMVRAERKLVGGKLFDDADIRVLTERFRASHTKCYQRQIARARTSAETWRAFQTEEQFYHEQMERDLRACIYNYAEACTRDTCFGFRLDCPTAETLRHEILKARLEIETGLLGGDLAVTADPFRKIEEPARGRHLLTTVVDAFIAANESDWSPKRPNDIRNAACVFEASLGRPAIIGEIKKSNVRRFVADLKRLPRNMGTRYPGMSLEAAIKANEAQNGQLIAKSSAAQYLNQMKAVYRYAQKEFDHVGNSPFDGFSIKNDVAAKDQRKSFSNEQLQQLVESKAWKDAPAWIKETTTLAYHTGCRIGEIMQLRPSDVQEEDGIVFLQIGGKDKKLKTASADRIIPLPDQIAITAQEWAASRSLQMRLINGPGADINSGSWSNAFSQRFGRLLEAAGVKEDGLSGHSLRHTYADLLRDAGIADTGLRGLLGHTDRSTTSRYGSHRPVLENYQYVASARFIHLPI